MRLVYLDNNASTVCDAAVVEAMNRFHLEAYGNPSSQHPLGAASRDALDQAADSVARLIGCEAGEVVFTSGGTEAVNLALRGMMSLAKLRGRREIVTSAVEHKVTRECLGQLLRGGCRVTEVGVDRDSRLDLDQLRDSLTDTTGLVSLIAANNETGVLADLPAISDIVAQRGVPLHLDVTQMPGKAELDLRSCRGWRW